MRLYGVSSKKQAESAPFLAIQLTTHRFLHTEPGGQQMPHRFPLNTLVILVHHLSITHPFSTQAAHPTHKKGLCRKTASLTKMLATFLPLSKTVSLFHFWDQSKSSSQSNVKEYLHSSYSVQQSDLEWGSYKNKL